jgi:hypothetical protein
MSSPVAPGEMAVGAVAVVRPRLRAAARVSAAALAIGLLGQLLFFGSLVGLNFPIVIAVLLGAAWLMRPAGSRMDPLDLWLPVVALLLAAFVALRGDPVLVFFDVLAAIGLSAGALAAIGGHEVSRRLLPGLASLVGRVGAWTAFAGFRVIADTAAGTRPSAATRSRVAAARPYLRGALIALPLLLIFTALFASADAVFARLVDDVFGVKLDLGELPGRLMLTAVIAWMAAGALAFVADAPQRADTIIGDRFRFLGTPEAIVVLVALDVLFAIFVALQAAYLFGGIDTVAASGLGYAEYARRGFFELLLVAALAGCLILAAEAVVQRRSRIYVAAAIGLMVMTGVVLASAFLRLRLYQDAFGWTELRFYVLATIGWLAIGIVLAVLCLALDRSRWLVHGLVVAAAVVGILINVVGPVRSVTEQNLARLGESSLVPPGGETGLDAAYLASLGDDAVPLIVDALPQLSGDERSAFQAALRQRRAALEAADATTWQAWNLGRALARDAVRR